jgi:hypothetical protein
VIDRRRRVVRTCIMLMLLELVRRLEDEFISCVGVDKQMIEVSDMTIVSLSF